ncbi:transposase, partial [Acidocella sp.]|uniref:transposase n=1 Tax=Acidocella sp. TaxID=50710 RepID=UPI002F3E3E83
MIHGWSALARLTMVRPGLDWTEKLDRWLEPFVQALGHSTRRRMPQYASALGKTANCQSLVSVTLASREAPVMVGLRLFLPESWTADPER